jgi:hypothetical protein
LVPEQEESMTKHSGRQAAQDLGAIPRELAELERLKTAELVERFHALVGEPTRSRNGAYLRKRLAWEIQAKAEGGLSERSLAMILELGDHLPARWGRAPATMLPAPAVPSAAPADAPMAPPTPQASPATPVTRDPRLPAPGTVLSRVHDGRTHEVTVGDGVFGYQGRAYRSLSAIAREITGTPWNGWTFFGLKSTSQRQAP